MRTTTIFIIAGVVFSSTAKRYTIKYTWYYSSVTAVDHTPIHIKIGIVGSLDISIIQGTRIYGGGTCPRSTKFVYIYIMICFASLLRLPCSWFSGIDAYHLHLEYSM